MKRLTLILLVSSMAIFSSAPASAFWGHFRVWGGGCGYGGWGCGPWGCGGPVCGGCCYDPFPYGNGFSFLHPKPMRGFVILPPGSPPLTYSPLAYSPAFIARQVPGPAAPAKETDLSRVLVRIASIEQRRKAERMLAEGDELFRAQKFHSALQRYKLAASAAPDLAEALWRKGHALVATHNYDLAVTAFKRAIELSDDVTRSGFRLDDLYGPAAMTKQLQLDALAEWALSKTESPDAWFLVAIFLYYDGQQDRSTKFFARAGELAGGERPHLAAFSPRTATPPPRLTSTPSPIEL